MFDDKHMFELVRQGDKDAFDRLFRRWHPVLVAYACRFVPCEDAENVVQDVMFTLWKRAAATSISAGLSSYLHAAVRNSCLNLLARNRHLDRYNSAVRMSVMEVSDSMEYAGARELSAMLGKALAGLSEEQRRTFEKNRFQGKKYTEIAAEEGVSVKTVEYRISSALRELRLALAEWL